MAKEPLEQYATIQPLVQKEISDALASRDKNKQFEVVKIPAHAHTGADSLPVEFSTLSSVNQYAAISRVTLTPAQILLLKTTPQVLVPQPGALSVIIVESITARVLYGGTAFTGANALEFRYTDGSGTKVTADMPNTFINSAANAFYHAPAVTTAFVPIEGGNDKNGRIVVCVPTADPAAGNSSMTIVTKYRVVPFKA